MTQPGTHSAERPVVFLGPSLGLDEARTIVEADFRPPAGQGDIFRAGASAPPAIALIDGIFKDAPTVRHREILWALSQGIPVFGAASMGALRAAELWRQGMIGVGLIFRWYRRYALLPDDAVAVTHAPWQLGAAPLSDALVDIRRSLSAAVRAGEIAPQMRKSLEQEISTMPFSERRFPAEIQKARISQKAMDARSLLNLLRIYQKGGDWPKTKWRRPPIVHAWLDDLADSGLSLDSEI